MAAVVRPSTYGIGRRHANQSGRGEINWAHVGVLAGSLLRLHNWPRFPCRCGERTPRLLQRHQAVCLLSRVDLDSVRPSRFGRPRKLEGLDHDDAPLSPGDPAHRGVPRDAFRRSCSTEARRPVRLRKTCVSARVVDAARHQPAANPVDGQERHFPDDGRQVGSKVDGNLGFPSRRRLAVICRFNRAHGPVPIENSRARSPSPQSPNTS